MRELDGETGEEIVNVFCVWVAKLVDAPSSSRALRLLCSNVDRAQMPEGHVSTIAGSSPAPHTKRILQPTAKE